MDLGLANPPISLPFLTTCLAHFVPKATAVEAAELAEVLKGKAE